MAKRNENALEMVAKKRKEQGESGEVTAGSLRERAMVVRFSTGRWYGSGYDEEVVLDIKKKHGAIGEVGTFTKRLMARERLADINQAVSDGRRIHKRMTLPWGEQAGTRLLPAELFFDYKKEMTACEMRFHAAVKEFVAGLDGFVKAEKERLGTLWKERDYPTREQMEARFRWRLDIEPLPNAKDFRVDLGEDEVERIRADIEERVNEAVREASHEVWERLFELVEKLKERMASSDGAIRSSLFENLKELVVMLPKLNVTHDPKLADMGKRIMEDLVQTDVEAVREDQSARSEVAKKADKILHAMDAFVKQAKKGG